MTKQNRQKSNAKKCKKEKKNKYLKCQSKPILNTYNQLERT